MKNIGIMLISALSISCNLQPSLNRLFPDEYLPEIVEESYKYLDIPYEWGGQSFWYDPSPTVDCSGLVINIYSTVANQHGLSLPFEDTTVAYLLQDYSTPINSPKSGDLIFMGEDYVSHIAIFIEERDGDIEFLDAYSETGKVGIRSYPKGYYKIKSFGRMHVR